MSMEEALAPIRPHPWRITAVVLVVTVLLTCLALVFPQIEAALGRTPAAIAAGEWWRFITPILINPHGWTQFAFNTLALAVVGAVVERQWGPRLWVVFYVAGGLAGEIAGLAWQPFGAGSSVAICGLFGALSVFLLAVPTVGARFGGIVIVAGGLILTSMRNLHGPPVLVGAFLAAAAWLIRNRGRASSTRP